MIPGIVNAGGEVVALGRRYWSPDLYARAGWEIELHFDQDDEVYPSVWSKGRLHRLCTAALIGDAGFAGFDATRAVRKEAKIERASVVRRQIAEVLDVIDQRIERACQRTQARNAVAGHHRVGNFLRRLCGAGKPAIEHGEVGHDEAAQGIDLDLEKIEAILERGNFDVGHGDLSELPAEASAGRCDAQRPNGAAK